MVLKEHLKVFSFSPRSILTERSLNKTDAVLRYSRHSQMIPSIVAMFSFFSNLLNEKCSNLAGTLAILL